VSAEAHSRTLFSYAAPIARHTGNLKMPVLITSRSYSVTTSSHTRDARRALHHLRPFAVWDPAADSTPAHADNVRHLYDDARHALREASNTRRRPENRAADLHRAADAHNRAEIYRAAFRIPLAALHPEARAVRDTVRRIDPAQLDTATATIAAATAAATKRREKAIKERERKYAAAMAEQQEQIRERRDRWLAGEPVSYPREHYGTAARLRVKGNAVETSHGARVHVKAAARLWEIAEGAHRHGVSYRPTRKHPVGPYQLDEVTPDGVRIGCHFIAFPEMQRIRAEVFAAAEIHHDETADA
jgi:hypothetical protein